MSGPEQLPPDDHELEDFIAGRGPHAARYRAAATERAPPALDALVMAQALALPPPRRAALQRWRLPLSLVATLVLGIGLVTRLQREPPPVATGVAEPAAPAAVLTEASAEQELRARVQSAEAVRAFDAAEVGRREVAAQAVVSATASARKAVVLERPPAEQRQAQVESLAGAAMAPEVVAESPPPPAPPPPPPPPSPPPSLTAPRAMAFAPASAAGSADGAAPVAAKAALSAAPRDFAGEARRSQRKLSEAEASAPEPAARVSYRSEQGLVLESSPGRYRLLAADGSLLAEGERLVVDGGREQLRGLGGEGTCSLWLEPPTAEAGGRGLRGDCEPGLQGEYREIEPER